MTAESSRELYGGGTERGSGEPLEPPACRTIPLLAVVDAYFEEEVQQLRSEFTPTAQLETFVFNIHARLTEAPTSALGHHVMMMNMILDAHVPIRCSLLYLLNI